MMSVTMVYLYIYVCVCVFVYECEVCIFDPNRLWRHSYVCCIHKNVIIWMTKTMSLFLALLFWMTSLPFE